MFPPAQPNAKQTLVPCMLKVNVWPPILYVHGLPAVTV